MVVKGLQRPKKQKQIKNSSRAQLSSGSRIQRYERLAFCSDVCVVPVLDLGRSRPGCYSSRLPAGVCRALCSANHMIMMDYSPHKLLLSISYSSKF